MSDTNVNYIITPEIFEKIQELNSGYEKVLKPLLSTVEAMSERIPIAIFNESRAFTDHMGRCYLNISDKEYIKGQLEKAERHLNRMIMDCYKELFIIYVGRIEEFKKYSKHVDLSYISDGEFYVKYKKLLSEAEHKKIIAKQCVSYEEDYKKFEEACIAYNKLDEYIQEHLVQIQTIKLKKNGTKLVGFIAWLIATVISAVLSNNNQYVIDLFKKLVVKQ